MDSNYVQQRDNSLNDGNNDSKVKLRETAYGLHVDATGDRHLIKKFVWQNKNGIEVQVINYGARVIAIKYPDRKGNVDDIVLGFDDLQGYLYYSALNFGGTIGRYSGMIHKGTFVINGKQYWVSKNVMGHCYNGGYYGFDSSVFDTYIEGKKVIMTLMSPDEQEGFPGSLLVMVSFELSPKNEFRITMEARSTKPTVINMSNLIYFNLGGQHSGKQEIYNHVVTLNCNCFTVDKDGLATGEVMNVVHSSYDYQVPKVLSKLIGIKPGDGMDQYLCVNKSGDQEDCFVARVLHPRSGRMLEIYSNQWGVHFETGNNFGTESGPRISKSMQVKSDVSTPLVQTDDEMRRSSAMNKFLILVDDLHKSVMCELQRDCIDQYKEIKNLIMKLRNFQYIQECGDEEGGLRSPPGTPNPTLYDDPSGGGSPPEYEEQAPHTIDSGIRQLASFKISSAQANYLQKMLFRCKQSDLPDYDRLANIMQKILVTCLVTSGVEDDMDQTKSSASSINEEDFFTKSEEDQLKSNIAPLPRNKYTPSRVRGKNNTTYVNHCGIAIQTQNYPNATTYRHFPSSVLNPGETYKHTITYKFWIRSGHPAKWLRRAEKKLEEGGNANV